MPDTTQVNTNTKGVAEHSYDAIVIGSGISGGWAAKELCEKGLKTLVLERGRNIEHIKDYPTMNTPIWEFRHRGQITKKQLEENPFISKAAGYEESTQHFFIKDKDHPYIQEKPFEWIRGYQVGGKSLIWGRACARWSEYDFTSPLRNGYVVDWPVRYNDMAPWYSHVERFIGVCGTKDGIEAMPDGEFLPAYELNCVEQHLKDKIWEKFKRYYVSDRWAQVTEPNEIQKQQKAAGVIVIDANTKQATEYFAKIIFVNASALNTNLILLNSTSNRFPNGLGNDNSLLGKYICHHNYRASMGGEIDGYRDKYYKVSKPAECIMPNFRNIRKQDTDFLGGYVIFSGASREKISDRGIEATIGGEFKDALSEPGGWGAYMYMQGETIPRETNHVRLSKDKKDQWGIPLLITSVDYDDNDQKMIKDFLEQGQAMMESAGFKNIHSFVNDWAPGLDIHEMGGVRMGRDPKTSLLNEWNQLHQCKNVFVTDGACMTSTGNQSPSILYMAFTARAVDHAVGELKKGNI